MWACYKSLMYADRAVLSALLKHSMGCVFSYYISVFNLCVSSPAMVFCCGSCLQERRPTKGSMDSPWPTESPSTSSPCPSPPRAPNLSPSSCQVWRHSRHEPGALFPFHFSFGRSRYKPCAARHVAAERKCFAR